MGIPLSKKHEFWNHFITRFALYGVGGGCGASGKTITLKRLGKAKEAIFAEEDLWMDVVARHGGLECTPEELDALTYNHCVGNFWGQVLHIMSELRLV